MEYRIDINNRPLKNDQDRWSYAIAERLERLVEAYERAHPANEPEDDLTTSS